MNQAFAKDIIEGLSATPKRLPSRYFYDKKGDRIFQAIMNMPEYYLTKSEYEILNTQKEEILELFSAGGGKTFELIELGAGDGYKTKLLLRHFAAQQAHVRYMPIDISEHILSELKSSLNKELPELEVETVAGTYLKALDKIVANSQHKKVLMFLGSNIGNMNPEQGLAFLKELSQRLSPGDLLFIGFDLKKHPQTILNAYHDQTGITRSFNVNLLNRINGELGFDFDVTKFEHFPTYNPATGSMLSYIVSTKEQTVRSEQLDVEFHFKAWETIHTEVSQKYSIEQVEDMAKGAGFTIKKHLYDCKHYFLDSVWEKR